MIYFFHNAVNKRKNKQEFNLSELSRYSTCNMTKAFYDFVSVYKTTGNMKLIADQFDFSFPYVIDHTQETARAYNAICTPDFYGFNRNLELQYRGRFDATGRGEPPPDNARDLFEAMKHISEKQVGPLEQKSSIGCSIKWRE